jgi:hypothetical protein
MTLFTIIFLLISVVALLSFPRQMALLPLIVGCCYIPVSQKFEVGAISVTVIRVLVAVGFIRVLMRGERLPGGLNTMDKLMLAWMAWIVLSSPLFPGSLYPIVFNLGQAYNIGGIYFLLRVFCSNAEELIAVTRLISLLLAPIAVEMVLEQLTGKNVFSVFGELGVKMREDKFRAQGPFGHAILAGTVGGTCFPLMVGIWKMHRAEALVGMSACLAMVGASNSSGPIMSLFFGAGAIYLWRHLNLIRILRRGAVVAYLMLGLLMKRPAYYVIASIDLTGSSTGWHRARLIESSIEHLDEWWLAGTNVTRHWMASGSSVNSNHTDITNYYILMGIWAGLPLMLLFIGMIWTGFRCVGQILRQDTRLGWMPSFMVWCVGGALFAHMATCVSVAYFDQSYIFIFFCLAAISSIYSTEIKNPDLEDAADFDEMSVEIVTKPNF